MSQPTGDTAPPGRASASPLTALHRGAVPRPQPQHWPTALELQAGRCFSDPNTHTPVHTRTRTHGLCCDHAALYRHSPFSCSPWGNPLQGLFAPPTPRLSPAPCPWTKAAPLGSAGMPPVGPQPHLTDSHPGGQGALWGTLALASSMPYSRDLPPASPGMLPSPLSCPSPCGSAPGPCISQSSAVTTSIISSKRPTTPESLFSV